MTGIDDHEITSEAPSISLAKGVAERAFRAFIGPEGHSLGDRHGISGEVVLAGYEDTLDKNGEVKRVLKWSIDIARIVDRSRTADDVAAQAHADQVAKEEADRRKGITKLPGMSLADKGDIVHTDENGVLLTDAEVAERRGDGRPVIERAPARPAVVVYTDGFKQQWPDDFAPGDDRPRKGDVLEGVDGAPDRWVIELLDMVTAEPIEDDPDGFAQFADQSTDLDDEPDDDDTSADGEAFSSDAASTPVSDLANVEDDDDTRLPTTVDFEDVSQTIPAVKLLVKGCDDIRRLRRLLLAEQRGRGTASEPRPAIVSHITARLVALGGL